MCNSLINSMMVDEVLMFYTLYLECTSNYSLNKLVYTRKIKRSEYNEIATDEMNVYRNLNVFISSYIRYIT